MFEYCAPANHTTATPDFRNIRTGRKRRPQWAPTGRADLQAATASPPRLRPLRAGEDEELSSPEALLQRPDILVDPPHTDGGSRRRDRSTLKTLLIRATFAGGLLVFLSGGLMLYASTPAEKADQVVAVKTVPIDGPVKQPPVATAAPSTNPAPSTKTLDSADFTLRFRSANDAIARADALRDKSQDRLEQTLVADADATAAAGNPAAPASAELPKPAPVPGSSASPAPNAVENEDQSATASAVAASPDAGTRESSTVTLDVNLRSQAEKGAPILTVVPKDATVEVGSCDRWWCAVSYDGQSGFVGKKFVADQS